MSECRDLLIELGTEELPPKALLRLSQAFESGIRAGLEKAGLQHKELKSFAAPRRLAILVHELETAQPDKLVERRGPAVQAAFGDDGMPTKAAEGFARSCGVEVDMLQTLETDKGAWLMYKSQEKGHPTTDLIPDIVTQALQKLPIPKRMRWSDLDAEFVRPVHWLVLLFGDEVIETEILTVKAGRETYGHRFHHPQALYLSEPQAYAPLLETEGHVVADFETRREAVRAQVEEAAVKASGQAVIDEALLDEVTSMVEWPVAVLGEFESRFLEVPAEALVSAMKGHQKYFHMVSADGALMPNFITVSNIDSKDIAAVRAGNERVIRPRLSDAAFFWQQDQKQSLTERMDSLKTIVFQEKLGTLYDKSQRVAALAEQVAAALGGNASHARKAGYLAKCDLMSEMVGEFPELQGIMGRYYARLDGEADDVAIALDEQYMPRFAGDALPQTITGQSLAIADKLDTLVGIFGIGQAPTGDKDPFALRRAALGVLRIAIENCLDKLDLHALLVQAVAGYTDVLAAVEVADEVYDFMMERLRTYYQDQGVTADVFESVRVLRPGRPYDFDQRVRAVSAFRELAEAESLAAANKRSHNILRQAREEGKAIPEDIIPGLLVEPAEKALDKEVAAIATSVVSSLEKLDYAIALQQMAQLREPVDNFFDDVMVMVDDDDLRHNRLALLNHMRNLFLQVADVSHLQG